MTETINMYTDEAFGIVCYSTDKSNCFGYAGRFYGYIYEPASQNPNLTKSSSVLMFPLAYDEVEKFDD